MKRLVLISLLSISISSNAISLLTGVVSNSVEDVNNSSAIDLAASAGSLGALGVADSASAAYDSTPSGWSSSISPSAINSFAGTLSEMSSSGGSFSAAVPSASGNVLSGPVRISTLTLGNLFDNFLFDQLKDLFKSKSTEPVPTAEPVPTSTNVEKSHTFDYSKDPYFR